MTVPIAVLVPLPFLGDVFWASINLGNARDLALSCRVTT